MAQIAAKDSVVAGVDWLVWRVAIMHNDTMKRGCRSAELYEHNLHPTYTLNSTNAYTSSLRELPADSLR